ncbi:cytochrome c biogenesis protein CcdC [Alicyclobacillaceae bacterium I2511]|nr:cytochrome c biogenesis protein CcdC [Alicyclobacillaceae bacterium I2511]
MSSLIAVVMALAVLFIRLKASQKPTNVKKIMLPPIGMSTGFLMFVVPQTHIPWLYALAAFLVGVMFSYPLILSSKMFIQEGLVYLKRSPAFIVVLLSLLVIRIVLHSYVEAYVTIPQTGALFFILAFGMLSPWRLAMLRRFSTLNKLERQDLVVE